MRGFYNYDTRGASYAEQIVNLERMVNERDEEIQKLKAVLNSIPETILSPQFYGKTEWGQLINSVLKNGVIK